MKHTKFIVLWLLFTVSAGAIAAESRSLQAPSRATAVKPPTIGQQLPAAVLNSIQLRDNTHSTNNQAIAYSRSVQVTLNVGGTVAQYRIGENPNLNGASWRTYRANQRVSYQFQSDTDGTKTVYAQVRGISTDPATFSAIRSDSIEYRKLPQIVNFRIDNGAATATQARVSLTWGVNGTATHFRVSESPNFSGVNWISGSGYPIGGHQYGLQQGAAGTRTVYIEMKRDASPAVRASDTINLAVGICPIGHRGRECSGAGTCNVNGSCDCNPDYSGAACRTVCQRCYGAAGTHCGIADGTDFPTNLGLCAYTPQGTQCKINAGSWSHDECCIRHRIGGPNPQQGSCTAKALAPPPYYCQAELDKAIKHLATELTWTRTVNFNQQRCTTNVDMPVVHSQMCNPPGGKILCSDQQYCCSRRASPALIKLPNTIAFGGGAICVCD